jgi:thioredoxin-like negative regulator of GroEL
MSRIETITAADIDARVLQVPGPVALDFYQATCGPCRALEPRLERVASDYLGRLRVFRVDLERDMPLAERFRITSVPTVLVLQAGHELSRLDGLVTEADLRRAFDRALEERHI